MMSNMLSRFSVPNEITIENSRLAKWSLYALTAFPVIDYGLRRYAPPLGSIWDKVILVILLGFATLRFTKGLRPLSVTWSRFAIYFFVYGLGLVFANFSQPLLAIAGYRIDVYYIFFALLIPFVVGPRDVVKLLYSASVIAILIGIHGVYQYVTKVPVPADWTDAGEHLRTRVFSVLISCNELGAYMALMIPILAGLAIYEKSRLRKWLLAFGIIPCTMTLLFAFSRAAWLSLALAVVLVAIVFERRLLIALAVLAVAMFFVPAIHHRIMDLFSPVYWMKAAHAGRVARWHQAFEAMRSNPLFGVGPGHYGGAMATYYHFSMYSDNYYAKTLGETGLIGLLLFFAMHIALMRDLWKRVRSTTGKKKVVFIGGLMGLLSVLIHNGLENVFEYAPMSLTYFLLISLFLVWGQPDIGEEYVSDAK